MKPVIFSWSGGKDSMLALHRLVNNKSHEVKALITTVNRTRNRVSMHGLRYQLVQQQAQSLGIPLHTIEIPEQADNETYQQAFKKGLYSFKEQRIETVVFGDIYLEDVRQYREQLLADIEMEAIFPIWGEQTSKLLEQFLKAGYKTLTLCIDRDQLPDSMLGRTIDSSFLDELPPSVDPCGEDGEFHSFVYEGPLFEYPVSFTVGETVEKNYPPPYENSFLFCDLIPTS